MHPLFLQGFKLDVSCAIGVKVRENLIKLLRIIFIKLDVQDVSKNRLKLVIGQTSGSLRIKVIENLLDLLKMLDEATIFFALLVTHIY